MPKTVVLLLAVGCVAAVDASSGQNSDAPAKPKSPDYKSRRDHAFRLAESSETRPQAIKLLEDALHEVESRYPNEHREEILLCKGLASVYFAARKFRTAYDYQKRAYDVCMRIYPKEGWPTGYHATVDVALNLGRFSVSVGKFDQFRPLMRTAVELIESAPIPMDLSLAAMQAETSLGLQYMGETEKALEFAMNAARVADRSLDSSKSDRAKIVNIYWICASQFWDIADIATAKHYAEKSVKLIDDSGVKVGIDTETEALHLLGVCYRDSGHPTKAIEFCRRAYDLINEHDPQTAARIAANLAATNRMAGNLKEAMKWLKLAKSYDEEERSRILYRLTEAQIFSEQGKIGEARKLLADSLLLRQTQGNGTDKTASVLHMLSKLDFQEGKLESAQRRLEQARQTQMTELQRLLTTASERALISHLRFTWRRITDLYLQVTRQLTDADQVERQYQLVSQQRGIIVRGIRLRNRVRHALSGKGSKIHHEFLELARQLPLMENPDDRLKTQSRMDELESQLRTHAPGLLSNLQQLSVPVDKFQAALGDREVLIDFVRYSADAKDAYAIFVLTPDQVYRSDLNNAQELREAIHQWRQEINTGSGRDLARQICRDVWAPVEKLIAPNVDTLYIIGDGDLLLMPWNALRQHDDSILLEKYSIATPPYPHQLLQQRGHRHRDKSALVAIGDISFGSEQTAIHREIDVWRKLPHTQLELEFVKHYAADKGLHIAEVTGSKATADSVLKLLPGKRCIHIATHGKSDFMSSNPDAVFTRSHPLATAKLVMAGANEKHQGAELSGTTISTADLESAELVFLSACDTGVGDVFYGEGVFGLQRAFHVAGAQNVISSLWQVDDAATALLVREFYKNYRDPNQTPLHALRNAQLRLYKNPRLLEEFKESNRAIYAQSRGLKFGRIKKKGDAFTTLPTALWAGFVYSGTVEVDP